MNCGGDKCAPCVDGKTCLQAGDCDSTLCSTTCQPNLFEALYKQNDDSATDNEIQAALGVANYSGAAIDASQLRVRYYYTDDAPTVANESAIFSVLNAAPGASPDDCRVEFSPAEAKPAYFELACTSGRFSVPNGGNSGLFNLQVHKRGWGPKYMEADDWSYDATRTTAGVSRRLVVYRNQNGTWQRVFGLEPPAQ